MGKFRKRVACKGKRWAKGQSSSSNPEAKSHRNAAKSRFFQVNLGNSDLTEFAVRKHEVMFGSVKPKPAKAVSEMSDDESTTGTSIPGTYKTFETFASDWSNCSNVSFSKLLTSFSQSSAIHKEMLAILAAVTEVIKEKNGTENSTEYFAALMILLDGTLEGDDYKEESVSAMLSLLSMGIKTVPRAVLQVKFADATKVLMALLGKYAATNNNVVMRSLIGCLSILLRAQDAVVWTQASTMKVYESILSFCAHSKPKIRKAAQHACCAILRASACVDPSLSDPSSTSLDDPSAFPTLGESTPAQATAPGPHHPACNATTSYIVRNIELNPALGGSTTTLHVLGFLKDVISCLTKNNVKSVCESILKVMTLGNALVISTGLQTLHSLFASRPSPSRTLPPALNAQLLQALYDYQPPRSDVQPSLAWLTTLGAGLGNLACGDLTLCVAHLPRFMGLCVGLCESDRMEVVNGATHTMQVLIEDCVAKAAAPAVVAQHRPTLRKIFQLIEGGLSYQYNRVWKQILHLLALIFKAAGPTCGEHFMTKCLVTLADLRDSYNFPCVNEVDYALGAAVRSMGVELVLQHIPYQITFSETGPGNEIRRSWLLPVLKSNIQGASLQFFIDYFLPLATTCRKRAEQFRATDSTAAAVSYDLLQTQIWSLLPSFCNKPRDVESFPKLAKVLGNVLTHHKDLRLTVLLALRRLLESSTTPTDPSDPNTSASGTPDSPVPSPILARYAKNYLPILLNLYTTPPVTTKGSSRASTDDENVRSATFQTLSLYAARAADRPLLGELMRSAMAKIRKAEDEGEEEAKGKTKDEIKFLKASILDVIRVLLPYQDAKDVEETFRFLQDTMKGSKDATETKKVYKILQEVCSSSETGSTRFVSDHLDDLLQLLIDTPTSTKTALPSQAARVKCLTALLESMSEEQLLAVVPVAVAGIKSVNSACRDHSFELVTRVAERILELGQEPGLYSLVDNLSVGLEGHPKLASASVLALASVTHHCRNTLVGTECLTTLLGNILVMLTSNTREIVASCLSFVKLLLTSFHKDDNGPHVPGIVREICRMAPDCKRHFRLKIKDIFTRLLRKYGDDFIFRMIPSHDVAIIKQVKNMIKIKKRKNKEKEKKGGSGEEEDEDEFGVKSKAKTITEILDEMEKDDDEELLEVEEKPDKKKGKKKKERKQFIQEGEDEILDFTDMANMGKISSSKPAPGGVASNEITGGKGKKKKNEFKMSEDGRLIIEDSDSGGEEDKNLGLGKLKIVDEEEEDEEDKGEAKRIIVGSKRKRGGSEKSSVRSEVAPASKYRAGGSGIHRPLKTAVGGVRREDADLTKDAGSVYKSKKSRGDMKRKGLPDPYAYVPLTRKLLNKRKKNKSTGQFKSIVKGAKKGAKIGTSMKSKDKQRKKK